MSKPPPFTAKELEERRPVWSAISDLFLDTDTTLFEDGIVRVLAASPYSENELARILTDEVQPVCWPTIFTWNWTGFPDEWLEAEICKRRVRGRGRSDVWLCFPWSNWFNRRSPQWRRIMKSVRGARESR
jgi:hypothetical protein